MLQGLTCLTRQTSWPPIVQVISANTRKVPRIAENGRRMLRREPLRPAWARLDALLRGCATMRGRKQRVAVI